MAEHIAPSLKVIGRIRSSKDEFKKKSETAVALHLNGDSMQGCGCREAATTLLLFRVPGITCLGLADPPLPLTSAFRSAPQSDSECEDSCRGSSGESLPQAAGDRLSCPSPAQTDDTSCSRPCRPYFRRRLAFEHQQRSHRHGHSRDQRSLQYEYDRNGRNRRR